MKAPVVIGGIGFPSKAAALRHCREILYRHEPGSEITGSDASFVMCLLQARAEKLAKIGDRAVVRFIRLVHRHNTECFFAELDDGTILDISFYKAVDEIASTRR